MASSSIPRVGSRCSMTLFAGDVLAHQHLVTVEAYPTSGSVGARFTDGAGVDVTFIGDRSSVAMMLAAALAQLRPPDNDPDPVQGNPDPAAAGSSTDPDPNAESRDIGPGSSLPEVEGGEAA